MEAVTDCRDRLRGEGGQPRTGMVLNKVDHDIHKELEEEAYECNSKVMRLNIINNVLTLSSVWPTNILSLLPGCYCAQCSVLSFHKLKHNQGI